jgi:hypothetical protein
MLGMCYANCWRNSAKAEQVFRCTVRILAGCRRLASLRESRHSFWQRIAELEMSKYYVTKLLDISFADYFGPPPSPSLLADCPNL